MLYRVNININDEDYIKFNIFQQFCTPTGKKAVMKSRIIITIVPLIMCVFYLLLSGEEKEAYIGMAAVCIILAAIFFFLSKPVLKVMTKRTVKLMIKNGKKPYTPLSTIEFYDDYFIEYTADNKSQINYSAIENVYKSGENVLYLFNNSLNAYLVPASSFSSVAEFDSFVKFIEKKTKPVIYA